VNLFPVAILAGGLATRLRPHIVNVPKSLIEVAGKPFICHQLDYLEYQGIKKVVLCIGYLGEMIQRVVGNGSNWGIDVSYSLDGPILAGTGGAIKQAIPLLGEKFFILYGDSYLPISYESVQNAFLASGKYGLMTVLKNQNQWDKSNVIYENGEIIEYNKTKYSPDMQYIDYGLGIINAQVLFDSVSEKPFDLSEIYRQLSIDRQLSAFEIHARFYEIGSHKGIAETSSYLLKNSKNDIHT